MNYLILALSFLISSCSVAQSEPVPANPLPAMSSSDGESIVSFINLERGKLGLRPLQFSDQLTCASSLQAAYLAGRGLCQHTGPLSQSFTTRAWQCGGEARGEVIICGNADFITAVRVWLRSPPHRAIIMDPEATQIGAARVGDRWVAVVNK